MDRQSLLRAGMIFTILGMLALVLVTPSLLGRPPELASLPILVVGMTQDKEAFVLDVSGAVQAYMYASVFLGIREPGNESYRRSAFESDTYNVHLHIPVNDTSAFGVHTLLVDRQDNYFEYNVTASLEQDPEGRMILVFGFPDEDDGGQEIRVPPDDLRWAIPLRGRL